MTGSANLAIVLRLLEEGWNQGRLDVVDVLVAPDLTYRIEDLFGAGDKVVLHWTATATDTIGFMGRPPTGRRASATGINIYRLAGGMLVEHWDEWDLAGLLRQLS